MKHPTLALLSTLVAATATAQDRNASVQRLLDADGLAEKRAVLAEIVAAGADSAAVTPLLAELVADPRPVVREIAAEALTALAEHADQALPVLESHLGSDDPGLRRVARMLFEVVLAKRRRDVDSWRDELATRRTAALPDLLDAISRDRTELAVLFDDVARLLPEVDVDTGNRILGTLRSARAREALDALAAACRDPATHPILRGQAVRVLGDLAPPDAPRFDDIFVAALAAEDLSTRGPALQALQERVRIRPDAGLDAFAALWRATRDTNLRQQLLNVWSRTNRVPAQLAALLAEDLVVTSGQLHTLAKIVARAGSSAGVDRFVAILANAGEPRSQARRIAARSLARYGARAKPAVEALCTAISEADPTLAADAVRALGRIPFATTDSNDDELVTGALRAAMRHGHASVRLVAAAAAVARAPLDAPIALALVDLLGDPDPSVAAAAEALAPFAGPALAVALEPTPIGPAAAAARDELLERCGGDAGPTDAAIRLALQADAPEVREAVLAALARGSRTDATDLLRWAQAGLRDFREPFVAARAADVARSRGAEAANLVADLAPWTRSAEPLAREAARLAIEAIGPERDAAILRHITGVQPHARAALLDLLQTPSEAAWRLVAADCAHADAEVRVAARAAADRLRAAATTPLPELADVETILRWRKQLERARENPDAAAERLLEIAHEAPPPVRIEALALLTSRVRDPAIRARAARLALDLLRTGTIDERDGAFGLLTTAPELGPDDWAAALCDPDPVTRRRVGLLVRIGARALQWPASQTLSKSLVDDPLPAVRRALARECYRLEPNRAAPIVEALLADDDPLVRQVAWQWFAAHERTPADLDAAIAAERLRSVAARPDIALALAARSPDGARHVFDALENGPELWRSSALAVLAELGERARPALAIARDALTGIDLRDAIHAAAAIAAMAWPEDSDELASLAVPTSAMRELGDRPTALAHVVRATDRADAANLAALRAALKDPRAGEPAAIGRALLRIADDPAALRADLREITAAQPFRTPDLPVLATAAERPVAVEALVDVLLERVASVDSNLPAALFDALAVLVPRTSVATERRVVTAALDHLAASSAPDPRWTDVLVQARRELTSLLEARLAERELRPRFLPAIAAAFVIDATAFAERYRNADDHLRTWLLAGARERAQVNPRTLLTLAERDLDATVGSLRGMAWHALAQCGADGADVVIDALENQLQAGRYLDHELTQALITLGPAADDAVPLLVSAFDRGLIAPVILGRVLLALGPRGITMLESLRPEDFDLVAALAADADRRTHPHPPSQVAELRALVRLQATGSEVAAAAARAVESPDPEVQVWAGLLACRLAAREPRAREVVRRILDHPEARVRIAAIEALEGDDQPALDVARLVERLDDPVVAVRRAACRALERRGNGAAAAKPVFRSLLADPDESVRDAARAALDRID